MMIKQGLLVIGFIVMVAGAWGADLPPLVIDKNAPLLLDEPPPQDQNTTATSAAKTQTPQLICYDCHGNYREESLAVRHAKVGVTCLKCHGESRDHTGDEANVTPPQIMFPREAIDQRCKMCHATHDAPAGKVIARFQERKLEKIAPKELVCTDCHGEHRLAVRTVHWDKKTGRLLPAKKKK